MANGVPVRLSEALTVRARAEAELLERSLTEQVEHWARLGQVVEAAISAGATSRLKQRSYDPELGQRLAAADTPEGQARAAALIRKRHAVRYSVGAGRELGRELVSVARDGRATKRAKRR